MHRWYWQRSDAKAGGSKTSRSTEKQRELANRLKLVAVEAQFKLAAFEKSQLSEEAAEEAARNKLHEEREAMAAAEKAKAAAKQKRVLEEAKKKKAEKERKLVEKRALAQLGAMSVSDSHVSMHAEAHVH